MSVLVNVTVTPGITAPVASLTVPVSAPVPADWARSEGVGDIINDVITNKIESQ